MGYINCDVMRQVRKDWNHDQCRKVNVEWQPVKIRSSHVRKVKAKKHVIVLSSVPLADRLTEVVASKQYSSSSSPAFQESLQARGRVRKDSGNMKVHLHSKLLHELRRVLLDLPRELNDTHSRRNTIISRLSQQ